MKSFATKGRTLLLTDSFLQSPATLTANWSIIKKERKAKAITASADWYRCFSICSSSAVRVRYVFYSCRAGCLLHSAYWPLCLKPFCFGFLKNTTKQNTLFG